MEFTPLLNEDTAAHAVRTDPSVSHNAAKQLGRGAPGERAPIGNDEPPPLPAPTAPSTQQHVGMATPFPTVRMVTWNCRSLWSVDPQRRQSAIATIRHLRTLADFVLLQELRAPCEAEDALVALFPTTHAFVSCRSSASAGVAILVNKQSGFSCQQFTVEPGYIMGVSCAKADSKFDLINFYGHTGDRNALTRQFTLLADSQRFRTGAHTILAGDFNFIESAGDSISMKAGQVGNVGTHMHVSWICSIRK